MTIFRWIMGLLTGGLVSLALVCLVVYISAGIDLWADRARKFGRLAWAAFLFWFNIEIWGRVVWTLIHW
jgi:hypothetical protein